MKDPKEMLRRIIAHETQYIESMCLSLKEDERTILRLQNKASSLQKDIEDRKQLIEEYRYYLKNGAEESSAKIRLIPSAGKHLGSKSAS